MDNYTLKNTLIDAVQAKPFNRNALMALLDEHVTDIRHDDFSLNAKHAIKKEVSIYNKNVTASVVSGNLPINISDYSLFQQSIKARYGVVSISSTGTYTYTITNEDALTRIAEGEPIVLKEVVNVSYSKVVVMDSVSAMISAYVSHYCSAADVQKILDIGCCPNHNNAVAELVSSQQAVYPGADKHSPDSRPLLNAIKRGSLEVASVLINHACPCCDGSGANVTDNLIAITMEGSAMRGLLESKQ